VTPDDSVSGDMTEAIHAAARWHVLLQSPDVSDAERHDWQQWLEADERHRQAWREVKSLQADLATVPGEVVGPALRGADKTRRELLRRLGMVAVAAPLAWATWRWVPWQRWQAAYTTATGERRTFTLEDGSQLILNTASAADVTLNEQSRVITLYAGEILVQTEPDVYYPPRAFRVETPQGRVTALGTRFTVRVDDSRTRVSVLEKAVRIEPTRAPAGQRLHQGEQTLFSDRRALPPEAADPSVADWTQGTLVVLDMPLAALLQELSRYRHGVLFCSEEIARLKVSGAFPLDDTDRALTSIVRGFPVREFRLSPYWVKLVPG